MGTTITYNEPGVADIELDNRIGMATSKFAQMKCKFYDVYVKSRLTYCCETWTLTKTQYSKINSAHTNFLRRLIRGGLHRKSSHADILNARKAASKGNNTLLDAVD